MAKAGFSKASAVYNRFDAHAGEKVDRALRRLRLVRRLRAQKTRSLVQKILPVAQGGPLVWLLKSDISFREGIAILAAYGAVGAAAGVGWSVALHSDAMWQATHLVGRSLGREAKENPTLREFLKQYRFVLVDGHCRLTGTNLPRIPPFGRIRLSAKKILRGGYEQDE